MDRWNAEYAHGADRRKYPADRRWKDPAEPGHPMIGSRLLPSKAPVRASGIRVRFFYGWLLVAIAFVTMAVGVNARTAFSLLFPAILEEFGWDRGVTAGAFSFGFLVSAIVTPFVGRLTDLRGPKIVVEFGVVTMGAGLIMASLI